MGLFTLLGFGLAGFALIQFVQHQDWTILLLQNTPVWYQIVLGVIIGLIITLVLLLIIELPWFNNMRHFFVELIGPIHLGLPAIAFISICAGIGEELFFRGAVQYWLGIWITAILFVLLHGYINPKNWRMSVYGSMLIIASAAFGYLAEHVGLLSAMIAHTIYDVVMFTKISQYHKLEMADNSNHQNLS